MLSKFSVRKPYTVLVSIVLILILGVISFTSLNTDLLPNMELPYVVAVTAYPGASPEEVEQTVTRTLEQALATTSGVENVTSISSENSSMVILEFSNNTNMDSAMIEMSSNIDMVESYLPDGAGSTMLMKLDPDMLPVMVASVDMEGKNLEELSSFVSEEILPAFERVQGIASVTGSGLLETSLEVRFNQEKIDQINKKILKSVNASLAEAEENIEDGLADIKSGRASLEDTKKSSQNKLIEGSIALSEGKEQIQEALRLIPSKIAEAEAQKQELLPQKEELETKKAELEEQIQLLQAAIDQMEAAGLPVPEEQTAALKELQAGLTELETGLTQIDSAIAAIDTGIAQANAQAASLESQLKALPEQQKQLEAGKMTLTEEMTKASVQLDQAEAQLKEAREEFETSRDKALKEAGLDGVLTASMLSGILTAENFSMPAGYITEGNNSYLIKVGEKFSSLEEIQDLVLLSMGLEDVDLITLEDVADISFRDNSSELFTKINGNDGILITFQKQSTSSTSAVSKELNQTIETLTGEYEGLHITPLEDQGVYIELVIDSVLNNLVMGGLLAVVILFFFLKSIRSTAIVAISIPMSLLFAVVLMYFSGVNLNIISLSGLALGVGMLVDNSIVVIENIYRLRSQGMPAAKAAVAGANQVAGAIFASTLTTICVFLPIVFTEGLSRQLFTDMGLTIAYSLLASLLVALTMVPALSASLMKKGTDKKHPLFDALTRGYRKCLDFSLKQKWLPLGIALILFAVSCALVPRMGTSFIPSMDASQISVTMEMKEDSTTDETREMAVTVMDRIMELPDVETIGAMEGSAMGMMMGGGSSGQGMSFYIVLKEDKSLSSDEIAESIVSRTADLDCTVSASSSSANAMSAFSSGLSIEVKGSDLDTLREICADIETILRDIEGTDEISSPASESAGTETRITVDKNKAMEYGLTVAGIYQELSGSLKTEVTSTTVTLDSADYPVIIAQDAQEQLSLDNLEEYTFTGTDQSGEEWSVALKEIASVSRESSLSSIQRDNQVRTMSVSAKVDSSHNVGLVSRELEQKLEQYSLPDGYTVSLGGETEMIDSAMADLLKMIALAVAFIYLIMVAQFQSLLSPFIVMFTIPLAFTGGLLGLFLTGKDISIISMLGFLILAGVVVNNGIVFVDYVNQLRLEGREKREALLETGASRIRPILMTALTTILGLSTMAFGMGAGADMLQPLAIVTIGGLLYATLLTLFVVPVIYDLLNRRPMKQIELDEIPEEV